MKTYFIYRQQYNVTVNDNKKHAGDFYVARSDTDGDVAGPFIFRNDAEQALRELELADLPDIFSD